jgi:Skp family chaperone for outer membrane proteins
VKRTVLVAGGILALGAILYAGRLRAQPSSGAPAPAAAPAPRTRIALLNLTYVLKNYEKFQNFQNEIKGAFEPFQKTDRDKKAALDVLSKEAQDPKISEAKREELARQIRGLQRDIQENQETAKAYLQKKGDEQMKILYLDVMDAAQRHARAHDFELVLHYNDATTRADFLSSANIARKLQAGALMPLYAVAGLDISKEVVEALNYPLRASVPRGGNPGGGN